MGRWDKQAGRLLFLGLSKMLRPEGGHGGIQITDNLFLSHISTILLPKT